MERVISASQANQRFSEMLRHVRDGDSYVVTSRGQPVARVEPVAFDLQQQAKAVGEFLEYVRTLPRRPPMDWKREDLYD